MTIYGSRVHVIVVEQGHVSSHKRFLYYKRLLRSKYKFLEKIYCFNRSEIALVDHAIHNGTETGHCYYITEYNYFEQFTNFIFTYSHQLFSAKLV